MITRVLNRKKSNYVQRCALGAMFIFSFLLTSSSVQALDIEGNISSSYLKNQRVLNNQYLFNGYGFDTFLGFDYPILGATRFEFETSAYRGVLPPSVRNLTQECNKILDPITINMNYHKSTLQLKALHETEKFNLHASIKYLVRSITFHRIERVELDRSKPREALFKIFPEVKTSFTTDVLEYKLYGDYHIQTVPLIPLYVIPSVELKIEQAVRLPDYILRYSHTVKCNNVYLEDSYVDPCTLLHMKGYDKELVLKNEIYKIADVLNTFNVSSEFKLALLWEPKSLSNSYLNMDNFSGSVFITDLLDPARLSLHNPGLGFNVTYKTGDFYIDVMYKSQFKSFKGLLNSDNFRHNNLRNRLMIETGIMYESVTLSLSYATDVKYQIINNLYDVPNIFGNNYNIGLTIGFSI